MTKFFALFGDDAATVVFKLNRLRQEYSDVLDDTSSIVPDYPVAQGGLEFSDGQSAFAY